MKKWIRRFLKTFWSLVFWITRFFLKRIRYVQSLLYLILHGVFRRFSIRQEELIRIEQQDILIQPHDQPPAPHAETRTGKTDGKPPHHIFFFRQEMPNFLRYLFILKRCLQYGMVLFGLQWAASLLLNINLRMVGVEITEKITSIIFGNFLGNILFIQLKLFLGYLLAGSMLGILCSMAVYALFQFHNFFYLRNFHDLYSRINRYVKALILLWLLISIGLIFWISALHYPQLYVEFFYVNQPWLRPVLEYMTDAFSPGILVNTLLVHVFAGPGVIILVTIIRQRFFLPALRSFFRSARKVPGRGLRPFADRAVVVAPSYFFAFFLWLIFFGIFFILLVQGTWLALAAFLVQAFFFNYLFHKVSFGIYGHRIAAHFPDRLLVALRMKHVSLLLLLVAAVLVTRTLLPVSGSESAAAKPNVVIVAIDSFRLDRLASQGNKNNSMPWLDSQLPSAWVQANNHVTLPRTFPSWMDIMTGKYGMRHGVRHMFPASGIRKAIGSDKFPTLPGILGDNGYHTAVLSDFAGDVFSRAKWGFKETKVPFMSFLTMVEQKNIEMSFLLLPYIANSWGRNIYPVVRGFQQQGDPGLLRSEVDDYLEEHQDEPFFLLTFLSPAHFPYSPPWPYYKKFVKPGYRGNYRYTKYLDLYEKETVAQTDKEALGDLFDGALLSCDDFIKYIHTRLAELNLDRNTILIVMGDHGEALYEGDLGQGHGDHVWGPHVTRSPVIWKFPDSMNQYPPATMHSVTSSLDFMPTLLDVLNIRKPKKLNGVSLHGAMQGEEPAERVVYSESGIWYTNSGRQRFQSHRILYPNIDRMSAIDPDTEFEVSVTDPYKEAMVNLSKHRSVTDGQYKLVYVPTRSGIHYELYDLAADPLNNNNIYTGNNPVGRRLKKMLHSIILENEKVRLVNGYFIPEILLH
jgi:arylsulfatase A-like enzyme